MGRLVMRQLLPFLLLGAWGCSSQSHASEAAVPPASEVWITPQQSEEAKLTSIAVDDHEVSTLIVTSGKISYDDLRVDHVFSPVTGRVTQISALLGQHVKKGDPLAVVESPDIGIASSDIAKADADLVAAEHDFKRQKELEAIRAVATKDLEVAEDNYRKARAEMERARVKGRLLNTGNVVGQGYVLRAHIDGDVVARAVNPGVEIQGQYAGGGPAAELFTVGDDSQVWVMADAFEVDLARVKAGEHVKVSAVAYPGKVFDGTVDWVSGALDPVTRTAKVRCTIPNPDHQLKPEMFATVSIAVAGKHKLAVPRAAVRHLGEQTVVFVPVGTAPDGRLRFERRPVMVDEQEPGDFVPVTRGVDKGEQVVTSGSVLLSGS
jgi:cobalt-zinc-cadmium efflux system membrane fusion protein